MCRYFVTVVEQVKKMLGDKLQGFCGFNTFSLDLIKDSLLINEDHPPSVRMT